nr:hypothetical protein [Shinella sp. PSBB067]
MDRQVGGFAVGGGGDDHLLHQLPHQVEMALHGVVLGLASAHDGGQRPGDLVEHRRVDGEGLEHGILPRRQPAQLRFHRIALLLEVVEQAVERIDLRLAGKQALGDLIGDGLLLAAGLFQVCLQLLPGLLADLQARGDLPVHPVLDRGHLLGGKQIVGNGVEDAPLELLAADRLGVRADDVAEVLDRQLLLPVRAAVAVLRHDGVRAGAMGAFE